MKGKTWKKHDGIFRQWTKPRQNYTMDKSWTKLIFIYFFLFPEPAPEPAASAYKHRSSETRAVKRITEELPNTPAKKVSVLKRLFVEAMPCSCHAMMALSTLRYAVQAEDHSRNEVGIE